MDFLFLFKIRTKAAQEERKELLSNCNLSILQHLSDSDQVKTVSYLASLRKSKGMSQEALAEACGLSLRAVQRIEAGDTLPRPHTIKVIANALDVEVGALTGRLNTTSSSEKLIIPALRIINFSAMSGLIIPFANVFVPVALAKKDKTLKEHSAYKRIISFQAIWSLITVLAVTFTPLLLKFFTQTVAFGKMPPPVVLAYGVMVLVNVFFTVRTASQLRSEANIYSWVPPVF